MAIRNKIKGILPSRKGNDKKHKTKRKINIRPILRKIWTVGRVVIKWLFYIIVVAHLIFTYVYKDPQPVQAQSSKIQEVMAVNEVVEVIEQPTETREQLIARLVQEVEAGKHGNGDTRRDSLGDNYTEVQKIIDQKYKTATKKTSSSSNTARATSGSKKEYQDYAHDLVIGRGWSEDDFNALVNLWNKESGWNPNAHNKSSGAHGIPQSLPASKMKSHGDDYYTSGYTQIRWGLDYIANRYGTPSKAWQHFLNKGWY